MPTHNKICELNGETETKEFLRVGLNTLTRNIEILLYAFKSLNWFLCLMDLNDNFLLVSPIVHNIFDVSFSGDSIFKRVWTFLLSNPVSWLKPTIFRSFSRPYIKMNNLILSKLENNSNAKIGKNEQFDLPPTDLVNKLWLVRNTFSIHTCTYSMTCLYVWRKITYCLRTFWPTNFWKKIHRTKFIFWNFGARLFFLICQTGKFLLLIANYLITIFFLSGYEHFFYRILYLD